MELVLDVVCEAVLDTAKLLPFLFVTYLAMEALEHGAGKRIEQLIARAGLAGPVIGSLLGAIPQCGFSAAAATFYAGGVVSLGTLVSVILSTSDEMLPVFIAAQAPMSQVASIIGVKVVCAILAGTLIDVANHIIHIPVHEHHIHDLCVHEHCGCCECDCDTQSTGEEHHEHTHIHTHGSIVRSALVHTIQVGAFILLVSLVLGFAIEIAGTQAVVSVASGSPVASVFIAGLVGLIPNCAASVALSELYLEGALGAPAMLAGLLVSGGTALLVLYRTNDDVRENLAITLVIYVVGVAVGLLGILAGLVF